MGVNFLKIVSPEIHRLGSLSRCTAMLNIVLSQRIACILPSWNFNNCISHTAFTSIMTMNNEFTYFKLIQHHFAWRKLGQLQEGSKL
jgi:hypothetical protein